LFIKLYKYEFRTITGTWKQGSSYYFKNEIILKIIKNKLGNIFENDSNKFDVKDKTSESPLFECM
jgi:hypothetical protein